jgi:hypothetical protein
MPFNKQFAFIFTSNISDDKLIARDIAHEIAHGTFDLRHTFSTKNTYTLPEGQTDNLMDYPTITDPATATSLNKYQWDLIHYPNKEWFSWLESEEEGAYVDENCFKDPNNYVKFKSFFDPLKNDPLFMKVFKILDNSTKLAYCFDELTSEEIEENTTSKGTISGGTYPYEKATFIGMRNIKTHEKYWFNQALKMKGDDLKNLIKSEDWKGRIGLNMSLVSGYVIFHELNHAVQYLLEIEGKGQYSDALREVETRMICFYAAFLKADVETRKDYLKMREFLESFYKNSYIKDLQALTGSELIIKKNDPTADIFSDKEIYSIVYNFFTGKENNDFNIIMKGYAKWIKEKYDYTYNPDEFKSNFYLFYLIK